MHKDSLEEHGYGIYYPDEERDAQKFQRHKQRLMEATMSKARLEIENRKMKLFQLVKWQHLKAVKEEETDRCVAKRRGIKYRTLFVKLLRTHEIMKKIYEAYLVEKQKRKKRMIAVFLSV